MERRLTAILAADVVGFSTLMGEDEVGTLELLKSCRRELVDPAIKEFRGRMVKLMGDGALVEFASVVDAVQCAAAIQRRMADYQFTLGQGEPGPYRNASVGVGLTFTIWSAMQEAALTTDAPSLQSQFVGMRLPN